ncbi:helix-turn-helix domain-containing protein [Schleiferilactobacillus harbinensis]|jgi:DNA-binding transcriptional regulator YiaG|uniref:helix-turn-helix domain-containing protein n=1 Tax=Schleiferilactobacillus harbinensis TaxID=304207 RepID=UPI0011689E1D|nr:helix-turn-helix domain-containing protein [Schleiferilactobacillus harbinensis]GEK07679.1 transcriptional regulator [Schleiferilactobacillus harbinensis]
MSTKVIPLKETYTIRGEEITITASARINVETGKPVFDQQLDDAAIEQAFAVYRGRHDYFSSQDIVTLRKQINLTQSEFADMLGWNLTTVVSYEAGALPSEANNAVLHALQDKL